MNLWKKMLLATLFIAGLAAFCYQTFFSEVAGVMLLAYATVLVTHWLEIK